MKRAAIALGLVAAMAVPAAAFMKIGFEVGDRIVGIRWTRQPIRYFVTNRDVSGVTAPELQAVVARAFSTWASVPSTTISSEFVGFTSQPPSGDDDVSIIGFRSRPDLNDTLGATTFNIDALTGEPLGVDIFLNESFAWSTSTAGDPLRFDLESIVVHEVGHLLGLGHSALGETQVVSEGRRVLGKRAVMFPIAYPPGNTIDRQLQRDDEAGLADIYGGSLSRRTTGSIGGHVRRGTTGVFGAHVTAFEASTGDMVSTFALEDDGGFVITGLTPGIYVVRAEPVDDGDIESFFESSTFVDTDFRVAYAPTLVAVPAGGASSDVEIRVQGK